MSTPKYITEHIAIDNKDGKAEEPVRLFKEYLSQFDRMKGLCEMEIYSLRLLADGEEIRLSVPLTEEDGNAFSVTVDETGTAMNLTDGGHREWEEDSPMGKAVRELGSFSKIDLVMASYVNHFYDSAYGDDFWSEAKDTFGGTLSYSAMLLDGYAEDPPLFVTLTEEGLKETEYSEGLPEGTREWESKEFSVCLYAEDERFFNDYTHLKDLKKLTDEFAVKYRTTKACEDPEEGEVYYSADIPSLTDPKELMVDLTAFAEYAYRYRLHLECDFTLLPKDRTVMSAILLTADKGKIRSSFAAL